MYGYIDFGWEYARRVWGIGYATVAAAAVLAYGIDTLKLSGIVAESAVENAGLFEPLKRWECNSKPSLKCADERPCVRGNPIELDKW